MSAAKEAWKPKCCSTAWKRLAYRVVEPPVEEAVDADLLPAVRTIEDQREKARAGTGRIRAPRLVESGVRFVTVAKGWLNYDTHGDNFNTMKKVLLPEFDKAFATQVDDLHQRGMLETTLVIGMGEFGCTPQINSAAGRDHHCKAWFVVFAGGAIPGGRILGATDSRRLFGFCRYSLHGWCQAGAEGRGRQLVC